MLTMKTTTTVRLCCTSRAFGISNSIMPRNDTERCPLVFAASATTVRVTGYNQQIKSSVIVNTETLFVTLAGTPNPERASTVCRYPHVWTGTTDFASPNSGDCTSSQRCHRSQAEILISVIIEKHNFGCGKHLRTQIILFDSSYFLGAALLSFPQF